MAKICSLMVVVCFAGCQSAPKIDTAAFLAEIDRLNHPIVSSVAENTEAVRDLEKSTDTIRDALLETKESVNALKQTLEAAQVQSKSEPGEEAIKSEDTSPDKNANDSQPATRSVAESGDVPLFVSVSRFCLPCNQLKKDFLNGKLKGFAVTFCVQSESHRDELIAENIPADQIIIEDINASPFPAIRYKSTESTTGWKWHKPRGYGPRVLMELRATLLGEKTPVEYPQTFVEPVQSHGDLVALHNTLHGGGQWTWPGDLATHLSQSHGVNLNGTAANYSGNQIANPRTVVRSVSRGPVLNWRARSVSRSTCPTCPR